MRFRPLGETALPGEAAQTVAGWGEAARYAPSSLRSSVFKTLP